MNTPAAIIPLKIPAEQSVYFIHCLSKSYGGYWRELSDKDATHDVLLQDILDAQHDWDVDKIIEIKPDGTWKDVSKYFADKWAEQLVKDGEYDDWNLPLLISKHERAA